MTDRLPEDRAEELAKLIDPDISWAIQELRQGFLADRIERSRDMLRECAAELRRLRQVFADRNEENLRLERRGDRLRAALETVQDWSRSYPRFHSYYELATKALAGETSE